MAPRRALRHILDLGPLGPGTIVMMLLFAYAVQELFIILTLPPMRGEQATALAWHLNRLMLAFVEFAVTAGLVLGVGKLFGGKATLPETVAGMAWFSILTAFLVPFTAPALPGLFEGTVSGPAALLLLLGTGLFCWMLAGCVAELHGFKSTGRVLFGMLGLVAAITLLANALLPAG